MRRCLDFPNRLTVKILLIVALAGCGSVAPNIESQQELAKAMANPDVVVVFGKVRWINNGEELEIGTGMFSNIVELQMYPEGSDDRTIAKVGDGGDFTWPMQPGSYFIPAVNFMDNAFSDVGNFIGYTYLTFEVPEGKGPTYIGTLIFETEYKSKFLTYESSVVSRTADDCESECQERLKALGLPSDSLQVSLIQVGPQVAGHGADKNN